MNRSVIKWAGIVAVFAVIAYGLTLTGGKEWSGVDDTVVGKYAEQAGHPAWKPLINTDRGDMLLFFFLIAGVCGGFLAGYCYRDLFPEKSDKTSL